MKLFIALLIVLQPALFAGKDLDDDPAVLMGDSPGEIFARWAAGVLTRWPGAPEPITLTYGFGQKMKPMDQDSVPIEYLHLKDIDAVFARAFSKWSAAILVTFKEIEYNISAKPDIKISFSYFPGNPDINQHLILAGLPPKGLLNLNAEMRWAIDFKEDAFDLESAVIHGIGHLLGIGHSHSEHAVMYGKLSPGVKKNRLTHDDVVQAQKLYGPNPELRHESSQQLSSGITGVLKSASVRSSGLTFWLALWSSFQPFIAGVSRFGTNL